MDIADKLVELIKERKKEGIKEYGKPLNPFNGRSGIKDFFEELVDGCQYALQVMEEDKQELRELIEARYRIKSGDIEYVDQVLCKMVERRLV